MQTLSVFEKKFAALPGGVDCVQRAGRMVSFSKVVLTIAIDDHVLAAETAAQEALCSILRLVMAISG
ncbi:MAG: hypothetical protein VW268_05595 [Rhodospirillaceae bacterium]